MKKPNAALFAVDALEHAEDEGPHAAGQRGRRARDGGGGRAGGAPLQDPGGERQ